jgi:TPR repeat protein
MKKLIEIMVVGVLMVGSVEANTLEEFNEAITYSYNPIMKQALICEREASYLFKNPIECIKAAQISLKEYNTLVDKPYGNFQEYTATMYSNAGSIYDDIKDYDNAIKMYKKALDISPNNILANINLGSSHYLGKGVDKNLIKTYEYFRVAAKQGDKDAQMRLLYLCEKSPWACK